MDILLKDHVVKSQLVDEDLSDKAFPWNTGFRMSLEGMVERDNIFMFVQPLAKLAKTPITDGVVNFQETVNQRWWWLWWLWRGWWGLKAMQWPRSMWIAMNAQSHGSSMQLECVCASRHNQGAAHLEPSWQAHNLCTHFAFTSVAHTKWKT